ncbi:hypothetical protein MCAG_03669 [Micromonospora sp. ATCC 39149]|nr:hypothetical protein MCAG_03669 [Micromonospora sp. ATCC 39149]
MIGGERMSDKYGRSALWERYNSTQVTEEAADDLTSFKSSDVNYKLALWDPRVSGVRYLKTLIFNLAENLGEANRARLRRIANRDVGDPISVVWDGDRICMDYLQAVLELEFFSRHVPLDGATVLEIGAGYGRTCHAVLSNHDVAAYHVVDLPNSLALARRYLGTVLTAEQLARVHFHGVGEVDGPLSELRYDLVINIDSFAEMTAETVRAYLAFVATRARHLYVNNPVGKYLDKSLDGHFQGEAVVNLALSTGLLRDVIDIHDNQAVRRQSRAFLDAYRPGPGWACVAESRTIPWSYYWQALYRAGEAAPAPGRD